MRQLINMHSKDKPAEYQQLQSQSDKMQSELNTIQSQISNLQEKVQNEPLKIEIIEKEKPPLKIPTVPEIIKDQLILISSLIFFVGIVSTHTYYAVFGIKYQFLDLPTFHIIYHGLIILVDAPYLLIPYILSIAWMVSDNYLNLNLLTRLIKYRAFFTYILIVILLGCTYPLAQIAGRRQAEVDLYENTSTLPKIVYMDLADGQKYTLGNGYRLLVVDSTYNIIFKPLEPGDESTLPNIKRISKGKVNVIETIR
jgi:hypothetical protein